MTSHTIEVWGEFGCFTSPVSKGERFTYPCLTPSAARGIFDAIYCKPPEFRWQIERIEILSPISYIALRRNEVKDVISERAVQGWISGATEPEPLWADADRNLVGTDQKGRTQRQTIALRNPRYLLSARIIPWPGMEDKQKALDAQFRQRAAKGKCFAQPAFGCREFPAFFRMLEEQDERPQPLPLDMDIGWMLYDVFDLSKPGNSMSRQAISVFNARIRAGVLEVPAYGAAEVRTVAS